MTPGNVKLRLPPWQSRGALTLDQRISKYPASGAGPQASRVHGRWNHLQAVNKTARERLRRPPLPQLCCSCLVAARGVAAWAAIEK